jgi:co-chaperonin GroES (HSP10)
MTDKKSLIIYDEKHPNGRPENAQEKHQRELQEDLEKQANEISNVIIPDTKISPSPTRILVIGIVPEPPKTKSGIIMPVTHKSGFKEGQTKTMTRYICIATGDEVDKMTFKGEKLEPGDEVIYMDIPDAVRLEIPEVFDTEFFDRTGEIAIYNTFDSMEIVGIVKRKKKEKKEKKA